MGKRGPGVGSPEGEIGLPCLDLAVEKPCLASGEPFLPSFARMDLENSPPVL